MKRYHRLLCLTLFVLAGCTNSPEMRESASSLPACGIFPNCVNSESGNGSKAIDPIEATPAQWRQLKTWLASQQDWSITTDTDVFLQAVTRTPLMNFRDDVQLLYDSGTGLIQVRSSSRLGIGDLGANRRRIEILRHQIAVDSVDQDN
jgi:uncharacterized protein (DUF1499 family)